MHAGQFAAGTTMPALCTNFGGVYEVTAKVVADFAGAPAFVFHVPMCRGKGGREQYTVVGHAHAEDDGFCLL